MQPLPGNQRPDPLTSLMNMSLVLRLPRDMNLCRSSSNVPRLPSWLELRQNPHVLLTSGKVQNPLHLPRKITSEPSRVVRACGGYLLRATTVYTFSTSQLPKVLLMWCVLHILISNFAPCHNHNGVHFFDITTSKSVPTLVCLVHSDMEMCFEQQWRALFRRLNFQKCSEREDVFYLFHLRMCFAPQRPATFYLSSEQMSLHPPL